MSKTMPDRSLTSSPRTFSARLSRVVICGPRLPRTCMVRRHRTTSKSRRSRYESRLGSSVASLISATLSQAVVWVPQRGNNNTVELPSALPREDYLLKDLEPLGWIKTQALDLPHLTPTDVSTQAKLMAEHSELGPSTICVTASFTPGSISLSAHSLSVAGFEWGRKNQDNGPNPAVSPQP